MPLPPLRRNGARVFLNRFAALALAAAVCFSPSARAGQDAEYQRAKGYYTLQEYQLAIEAFAKFIADYPAAERAEDARLMLAESHYQMRHFDDAAKAFDVFLSAHPQSAHRADALLRAVKSHAAINDFKTCLKDAKDFIAENRAKLKDAPPQDPIHLKMATALYHAGDSSYALKDFENARTCWEELLRTQPQSPLLPDVQDGLGWLYFDAKEFDKARASFHAVAALPGHPRAAWARLMEGRSLAAQKKWPEALEAIQLAQALSGANQELRAECALRGAETLLDSGDLAKALDAYRKMAQEFPVASGSAPALAAAASRTYEAKQFTETAELAGLYLKVTSVNTAAGATRAAVGRMQARALNALNKPAEALEAARGAVADSNAVNSSPEQTAEAPASLMLLAELAPQEAPALYTRVAREYPSTVFAFSARYESARLLGEAGKLDDALTQSEALLADIAKAPAARPGATQIQREALFAAAEFAFRKPDYAKAIEILKTYLKAYGNQDEMAGEAAYKLAWSLNESGNVGESVKTLDAALADFPKSKRRDELLFLRARCAEKLGEPEPALKYFDALLSEFPDSQFAAPALYASASLLYKGKQFETALTKLNPLLARPGTGAELRAMALQMRASALLQSGKYMEAQADAEELLKVPAPGEKLNLPALRLIKALALLAQPGKEAPALEALSDAIAKGPADAAEVHQALERRALLFFSAKNYVKARPDLLALVEAHKGAWTAQSLDTALRLAVVYREIKERFAAKELLEKIVTQKDVPLEGVAAFEAPLQLGNLLFEANNNAGAAKLYQQALTGAKDVKTLSPESLSAARLNLAWALSRTSGKENEAEQAFADLVKGEPNGAYAAEGLIERARLLIGAGKNSDALPLLAELQDRFAASRFARDALFMQGEEQAKAGNFKDAASSFEHFAEKYPDGAARDALCGLGESRLHLSEIDKAREAFMKALGEKGVEAGLNDVAERALLGLADIALKNGDAAGAKKLVLRILTEDPESDWADAAYFISGQSSEALKEPERAIGYYRKLLSERPKSIHVPAAEERLRALGAPK